MDFMKKIYFKSNITLDVIAKYIRCRHEMPVNTPIKLTLNHENQELNLNGFLEDICEDLKIKSPNNDQIIIKYEMQ